MASDNVTTITPADVTRQVANAVQRWDEAQFAINQREVDTLVKGAQTLVVNSTAAEGNAADIGKRLKGIIEDVERIRTSTVQPFNEYVKLVNAKCKSISGPIEAAMNTLRARIQEYRRREEERIRKEQAELEREHAKALAKEEKRAEKRGTEARYVPPPPPPETVQNVASGKVGSTQGRKVWKFKIVDPTKVPNQWWVIDERAIGDFVKRMKADTKIPGVEVYQETEVAFL